MTATQSKTEGRYTSIRKAAKASGIGDNTFRCMVKAGQIPGFYIGNRFRVDTSQLDAVLERLVNARAVIIRQTPQKGATENG